MTETKAIPTETAFWWVRINGEPTVIKVMFQCQDLWPKDVPSMEVRVFWPCGDGDCQLGYMDKETGKITNEGGEPYIRNFFEWMKPIPWDDVPLHACTAEQIAALPVAEK